VHSNFGYNWTKITDALYEYLHTLMATFVTVVNMIMWATKVNTVCPVIIVNLLTNIPTTAL